MAESRDAEAGNGALAEYIKALCSEAARLEFEDGEGDP